MAEGTLDHLLTDMRAPEGGFYSALDADSEGEEGTFYVWTPAEVRELLDEEVADLFMRCYDVSEDGNFEKRNIPPPSPRPRRGRQARGREPRVFARAAPGREAGPVGGPKPPRAPFPRREDPRELERNGNQSTGRGRWSVE